MPAPKGHKPYNTKGEGGRPAKFSLAQIDVFADELIEWVKVPSHIFYKDFCLEKGINPDKMTEWAEVSERFRGAYQLASKYQESKIANGTLNKAYDSNFARFYLINKHGYAEKNETKISGDAQDPFIMLVSNAIGKSEKFVDED
jgi:hypothetical protein